MSIRTGVVAVSIVSLGMLCLGMLCAACTGAASSGTARPKAEPSLSSTGAPSVHWLRVAPEQSTPNSVVLLDVACLDDLGTVQSPVLDMGPLQGDPEGHQPWHLFGTATVRPDAVPGRYRVSATCGASELFADFTVVPGPSR